jgi:nucleoside 2-deoxyribosyltransferase
MKVYLAGPDVFLPNAKEVLGRKAELARAAGFTPIVPGDSLVKAYESKRDWGLAISAVDEAMMLESAMIIANLTPFRGVSADVGTVFELGFMCALGRHAYGYSNTATGFYQRTVAHYEGEIITRPDGHLAGPDGLSVEDFDLGDNLMLDGGIISRGGTFIRRDVPADELLTSTLAFEEVLAIAAKNHL